VQYLVAGGYAVSFHAQPRATKDLDLLVKPDLENARALYRALAAFGSPLQDLEPEDFAEPGSFFSYGHAAHDGGYSAGDQRRRFRGGWSRRIEAPIDAEGAVIAPFIFWDDLISAKMASARKQDLADVAAIRKARGIVTKPRSGKSGRAARKPPSKP
jgi:hypothetical protein